MANSYLFFQARQQGPHIFDSLYSFGGNAIRLDSRREGIKLGKGLDPFLVYRTIRYRPDCLW